MNITVLSALLYLCTCVLASAQQVDAKLLRTKYDANLTALEAQDVTNNAALLANYKIELQTIKDRAQQAGDLDRTIIVLAEIARFQAEKSIAVDARIPEIKVLATAFQSRKKSLDAAKAKSIELLTTQYDNALAVIQRKLVQAGKLDEATAVQVERYAFASTTAVMDVKATFIPYRKESDQVTNGFAQADVPTVVSVQESRLKRGVGSESKTNDSVDAILALPDVDRPIASKLRFTQFDPVKLGGGCFYASITSINSSQMQTVRDKLTADIRILCRDKDMTFRVICRTALKFNITTKGRQEQMFGIVPNSKYVMDLNGGKVDPFDAYIIVRYLDAPIFEQRLRKSASAPDNWWKDDVLVYSK